MSLIQEVATMTAKGQITVPKPIRQALGADVGTRVRFELHENGQVVVSRADAEHEDPAIGAFLAARALGDDHGFGLVDDRMDYGEGRWLRIALVEGRVLSVTCPRRAGAVRIVSARSQRAGKGGCIMGKTVAHTPDPGNPATPSEAECTFPDGLSDAAIEAAAKADPDNRPATRTMETRARIAHVVRWVRAGTGLSHSRFAARFGFSAAAVRDWEQGRRTPEASTLSYLRVIECEPQVERALAMT